MAVLVQVTGEPGTGKSYSSKTLNPKTTYMIDCDGKGLAWAGWRADYNSANKNYAQSVSDTKSVFRLLKAISDTRDDIKCVVVDTISTMMSDEEVRAMKKTSHNIWRDYAIDIYELYGETHKLREDLVIVFIAHPMLVDSNDGSYRQKLVTKVGGKKATTMNLGGKLNYNLYTHVERDGKGGADYSLLTQSDNINEARSVAGVLPYKIPNDLGAVVSAIREKDLCI